MSEKIFALLVRFYPPAFRRKYREEVLRLYRDRFRDERGLFLRIRLFCDVGWDTLRGIPIAWRNAYPEKSSNRMLVNVSGGPSFHVLDREPLKPGSIVAGCVISIAALVGFGVIMRLPAPHRFSTSGNLSPVEAVLDRLNQAVSASTRSVGRGNEATVNGDSSQAQAASLSADQAGTGSEESLSARQRDQVVQGVSQNLTAHYFDRQKAEAAVARIRELETQGTYAGIVDGPKLAERLTEDLQSATSDPHIHVAYSRNIIPDAAPAIPTAAEIQRYKAMLAQENCSIEDVKILPGNLGYLKFNSFPDLTVCGADFRKALAGVGNAHALIFDLRDNTGGFPETVAEVAAPLFDRTVAWYNPRSRASATMLKPAAGSTLSNKPVYILTSSRTLSGAEQFTYNLKMLKRATIVGDTTGGGAHVGAFHRVDEHFGVGIPETKITNPYGGPDWDGIGVEPDVKVKAAEALSAAEALAAKGVKR